MSEIKEESINNEESLQQDEAAPSEEEEEEKRSIYRKPLRPPLPNISEITKSPPLGPGRFGT